MKNLLQTYPTERLQPLTAQHQQNKPLIADIFRLPSIEEDDIDEFGMPYSAYTAEAAPKTVTVPGEGQAVITHHIHPRIHLADDNLSIGLKFEDGEILKKLFFVLCGDLSRFSGGKNILL